MSLFRIRNPGILFDADSPAQKAVVVTGQGAPSGAGDLAGASFGVYLRENASNTEAAVYLTVDSGTTWIAMAPAITSISDPGTGAAIPVGVSAHIAITTAAAETNTLAIPTFVGQKLILICDVYAVGDRVVTVAAAVNQTGNNTLTFGAAGDLIVLEGSQVAGALVWRVTANDGVGLTTV